MREKKDFMISCLFFSTIPELAGALNIFFKYTLFVIYYTWLFFSVSEEKKIWKNRIETKKKKNSARLFSHTISFTYLNI